MFYILCWFALLLYCNVGGLCVSDAIYLLLQPDRVMEFCNNNDLQLIVRAHECVMDGFERFAQGHLITLFSATNYCGRYLSLGTKIMVIFFC